MSAKAGWYPDPGGGLGLFRYWDGKAWSAATSPNPSAPPPTQGLVGAGTPAQGGQLAKPRTVNRTAAYGQTGQPGYGQPGESPYGQGYGSAYANYQEIQKKKSPVGWWIAGVALVSSSSLSLGPCHPRRYRRRQRYHGGPGAALAGRLPGSNHRQP